MSHRIHDPNFLQARYRLNGSARDTSGHNVHGVLFNAPTWGMFNRGLKTAIRFDGNDQYANIIGTTYLDSTTTFTICTWLNQDVIAAQDRIFFKYEDADNNIEINTDAWPIMQVAIENCGAGYGEFDYSAVVSANNWHHLAVVYYGGGAANIDRLIVYVDGAPVVLAFTGTIPATTALTTANTTISGAIDAFAGMMYDFRIYTCSFSRDEVNAVIHSPVGVL